MQLHASCAAHQGDGVLLLGAPGSGKSDLLLRLLDHGFELVADDQVIMEAGTLRPSPALAGLMEVRGLGILRLPFRPEARACMVVQLGAGEQGAGERLPAPAARHGLPLVHIDPAQPSAPARVLAALRCLRRETELVVGAFA